MKLRGTFDRGPVQDCLVLYENGLGGIVVGSGNTLLNKNYVQLRIFVYVFLLAEPKLSGVFTGGGRGREGEWERGWGQVLGGRTGSGRGWVMCQRGTGDTVEDVERERGKAKAEAERGKAEGEGETEGG